MSSHRITEEGLGQGQQPRSTSKAFMSSEELERLRDELKDAQSRAKKYVEHHFASFNMADKNEYNIVQYTQEVTNIYTQIRNAKSVDEVNSIMRSIGVEHYGGSKKRKSTTTKRKSTTTKRKSTTTKRKSTTTKRKSTTTKRKSTTTKRKSTKH